MPDTRIIVNNNGSLKVEGDFTVCDVEGNAFDLAGRKVISFCRCGHSENKPFCDGTHKVVGFVSECKAFALGPPKPKI